jgi:hypothetical protein
VDRNYLAARVVEQALEVLDGKVADADIAHLARADELLHLAPRVDKVPVVIVLLEVVGPRRRRPVHQVQINVVGAQRLERRVDALLHTLVPRVVELGRQPDLVAGDARLGDAVADFLLVAVCERRIDVAVPSGERGLDGFFDFVGLGFPCPQPNSGYLIARVERERLPGRSG